MDTIQLISGDLAHLRHTQIILNHYQAMMAALQAEIEQLLTDRYEIDLINENWELDLDAGHIRRTNQPGTVLPPAPDEQPAQHVAADGGDQG